MKASQIIDGLCLALLGIPLGLGASLEATITSEDGKPVTSGFSFSYYRLRDHYRDAGGSMRPYGPAVDQTVDVPATGRVSVKGLPPGKYTICARSTKVDDLASCEWYGSNPQVEFKGDNEIEAVNLVIRKGITITFRIPDPSQRLVGKTSFVIGVLDRTGYYRRAQPAGREGDTQLYQCTIPRSLDVDLLAHSDDIRLTDERGFALADGARSLPIPGATTAIVVNLQLKAVGATGTDQ